MKEIVCDRCGDRRSLKNETNYISDFAITRLESKETHMAGSILVKADLCGDCVDTIINQIVESITNHRIGNQEFFVSDKRFSVKENREPRLIIPYGKDKE